MKESAQGLGLTVKFESNISLEIVQGDITRMETDAIANAANKHLRHGGGVAGAISRRGGPAIQAESDAWTALHGPIDADHPAVTNGGKLPCKHVIHAVGPVWGEGEEDDKLARAITSALEKAEELKLSSISLPAISTGIFGFPLERAAGIFMQTLDQFCRRTDISHLTRILIVLFDAHTYNVFSQTFNDYYGKK